MKKVFFHFFSDIRVPDTDRHSHEFVKDSLYFFIFACFYRFTELLPFGGVVCDLHFEPGTNPLFIDSSYFPIRNYKLMHAVLRFSGIGQVSCRKKYAPQISLTGLKIIAVEIGISQFRNQNLLDCFTRNQRLYLTLSRLCCRRQNILYNCVTAAVFPMGFHWGILCL